MIVRIADLEEEPHYLEALEFEEGVWARIVETVRCLGILDTETIDRLAVPSPRLEVTREQARKLGTSLESWIFKDILRPRKRPVIPSYIVPIATSNGLWIDPALPLLHRNDEFPTDLFKLTLFCLNCSGFSIN